MHQKLLCNAVVIFRPQHYHKLLCNGVDIFHAQYQYWLGLLLRGALALGLEQMRVDHYMRIRHDQPIIPWQQESHQEPHLKSIRIHFTLWRFESHVKCILTCWTRHDLTEVKGLWLRSRKASWLHQSSFYVVTVWKPCEARLALLNSTRRLDWSQRIAAELFRKAI